MTFPPTTNDAALGLVVILAAASVLIGAALATIRALYERHKKR